MKNKQTILRAFLFIFGGGMWLFYALPLFFAGIFNVGTFVGMCFFGCMFIRSIFYDKILKIYKEKRRKKPFRIITNTVCIACIAGILTFSVISGFMIKGMLNTPPENTDIIVRGCKVNGENPSKMLNRRIKKAEEYLKENPDAVAVLSGGQGSDENISEAQCMYNTLVSLGIAPERLIKEDISTSTKENITFSKEILNLSDGDEITVVTDGFHEFRAYIICKENGLTAYSVPANTPWTLIPVNWTREVIAVAAEWILY